MRNFQSEILQGHKNYTGYTGVLCTFVSNVHVSSTPAHENTQISILMVIATWSKEDPGPNSS